MKRVRTLPSGKTTTSERRYVQAWRRLGSAPRTLFDAEKSSMHADPGIQGDGFSLCTNAAIRLWEHVNRQTWKD